MKCWFRTCAVVLLIAHYCSVCADTFEYTSASQDMIGKPQYIMSDPDDTLAELGRKYDIGHVEMIEANPNVHPAEPIGERREIVIPSEFILPPGPRTGIVINLAELRLYYYHPNEPFVTTEPIGIGRDGWNTPLGITKIVEKRKDPTWIPTANILRDAEEQGIEIPKVIGPGEDNPLGRYALRLGWSEYSIHGTNRPEGVGRRSSAGCIRMFPEDIEHLFNLVEVGTKVRIINEPIKFGWSGRSLFIEAHAPLREDIHIASDWMEIVEYLNSEYGDKILVSWSTAQEALNYHIGLPIPIGQN